MLYCTLQIVVLAWSLVKEWHK